MPNRDLEAALSRPVPEAKAELFQALAHPARIRVLEVLSDGERSVGEMQPLVGIESSHLSQQLAVLRRAGLVTTRKEGSTVFYSLRASELAELLAVAKRFLIMSLSESAELLAGLQPPEPRERSSTIRRRCRWWPLGATVSRCDAAAAVRLRGRCAGSWRGDSSPV